MFKLISLARGNYIIVKEDCLNNDGKVKDMPVEVHGIIYVYVNKRVLEKVIKLATSDELKKSGELEELEHKAMKHAIKTSKRFWYNAEYLK